MIVVTSCGVHTLGKHWPTLMTLGVSCVGNGNGIKCLNFVGYFRGLFNHDGQSVEAFNLIKMLLGYSVMYLYEAEKI